MKIISLFFDLKAKKYKLSGIKIIINSPTGKELVSKNC